MKSEITLTSAQQAQEFVIRVVDNANKCIRDEVLTLHPAQRFVVMSRIVARIFNDFFGVTISQAESAIKAESDKAGL